MEKFAQRSVHEPYFRSVFEVRAHGLTDSAERPTTFAESEEVLILATPRRRSCVFVPTLHSTCRLKISPSHSIAKHGHVHSVHVASPVKNASCLRDWSLSLAPAGAMRRCHDASVSGKCTSC